LLDFADTGELGLLVSEESVAARELTIGRGGVMRGRELAQVLPRCAQRLDLALCHQRVP